MTVITLNEYKSKEEIINCLLDYNLIPSEVSSLKLESEYFKTNEFGDYELNINITHKNNKQEEIKYIISYIENEKVSIKNNSGVFILTSLIILLICLILLTIKLIKKIIIKRKKHNNDSIEP